MPGRIKLMFAGQIAGIVMLCHCMTTSTCRAQGTNTFPTSGYAGIGTVGPAAPLQIDDTLPYIYLRNSGSTGRHSKWGLASEWLHFSVLETPNDVVISASSEAEDLILTTIGTSGSIRFGTTEVLSGPDAGERERMTIQPNGYVGINGNTPSARFQVTDGSVMFNGAVGFLPTTGSGTRFMWVPAVRAIRAGEVSGFEWDRDSIGAWSASFGQNTVASGSYSFSAGNGSAANGSGSTAFGDGTRAVGSNSFAAGYRSLSTQPNALAIGSQAEARATGAVAIGTNIEGSGASSVGIGSDVTASGSYSVGLGQTIQTLGANSFAIGKDVHAEGASAGAFGERSYAFGTHSLRLDTGTVRTERTVQPLDMKRALRPAEASSLGSTMLLLEIQQRGKWRIPFS